MTAITAGSAVLTGMPAVTALQRKKSCSAARMAMSWDFGHLCSREGKTHGLMMTGWLTSSGPYPDCAITLSIGEKSKESYQRFKDAGADRYLLRHETASEEHYRYLHPESLSLTNRKQCLYTLKELGYQIGAGFMVGAPGQILLS